jgi:hypothetical protein
MRKEKSLGAIIAELEDFPRASTVEPVDGGAIVLHLPDGKVAEVITFYHEDDAS